MFPQRLKQLRKDYGFTQEELGKKINVTKVSISGYENGNRTPDTDTLQKIADLFEVQVDYLLGRTNEIRRNEKSFDPLKELNKLLDKYGIEDIGFFDIEKWKEMGPEGIKKMESYFQFLVAEAENRKQEKD